MKRYFSSLYLMVGVLAACSGAGAQASNPVVKEVNVRPTRASQGDELYGVFCAVCHGKDGRGAGPAASALKQTPTDLTLITKRNNGKFPALEMRSVIKGSREIPAHGNSEMPTWGDAFRSISANQAFADMRINNLVKYLESIQR